MELIRYIHLNPLRAKLVQNLNELDKYPWSGHSAILGQCKNPLVPEVSLRPIGACAPVGDQRSVVSNPKAPSIPSAKGGLFFQFRPETEKDNKHPENPVNPVKDKSLAEKTIEDVLKKAIEDLIKETSETFGVAPEVICSRSRQRKHSAARSAVAYLAVEETGHSAADVARVLGVKRMSLHEAVIRDGLYGRSAPLSGQRGNNLTNLPTSPIPSSHSGGASIQPSFKEGSLRRVSSLNTETWS